MLIHSVSRFEIMCELMLVFFLVQDVECGRLKCYYKHGIYYNVQGQKEIVMECLGPISMVVHSLGFLTHDWHVLGNLGPSTTLICIYLMP